MSSLKRFFTDKISDVTVIDGEEFRHAVSVLRIKVGENIIICDNSGFEYTATVTSITKKEILVSVKSKNQTDKEANTSVTLIAGYLKGDKTELIVQKAVELGVKKIVVFSSQYSSSYINENKLSRLNRVSVESAKQCGRSIAPPVVYEETLEKALKHGENIENKLFACEFASSSSVDLQNLNGSTAIVVGSEGGFSESEFEMAKSLGFKTVYLGKRILRAETACIVLTGIVMNTLGELK